MHGNPLHSKNLCWKAMAGYSFLFAIFFFILLKAPLISDDFEFADYGYASFSQAFPYILYYGNGRLLGNLGVALLINYPVICAMMKAVLICGTIWAIPRAAGFPRHSGYAVVSAVVIVLLNPDIFGQVFTWTSGFMNYVPPILTMLLCMMLVRSGTSQSVWRMVAVAVLGFAGQLFVEHSTVIHILLAAMMLVYYYWQKDKVRGKYALCWLVSGIVGAIVMFAIPRVFFMEDNRTSGYRVLHMADMIAYSLESAVFIMNVLSKCTSLLVLLSIFALLLQKRRKSSAIRIIWYLIYPAIAAIFAVVDSNHSILRIARYVLVYAGMVPYILFLATDIWKCTDSKTRIEMLTYMVLAILSVLPFLVISPFGERCLYLCYALLCMMLFRGLLFVKDSGLLTIDMWHKRACIAAVAACSVFLCGEFMQIHTYNMLRDSYIKEQIASGTTEITIYNIPSRYTFATYLADKYYYRNERGDIKFEVVDYETWVKMTGENQQ